MALSKTGRFLSKAEILGVGVFSPLSTEEYQKFTVVFFVVFFGNFQDSPGVGQIAYLCRRNLASNWGKSAFFSQTKHDQLWSCFFSFLFPFSCLKMAKHMCFCLPKREKRRPPPILSNFLGILYSPRGNWNPKVRVASGSPCFIIGSAVKPCGPPG